MLEEQKALEAQLAELHEEIAGNKKQLEKLLEQKRELEETAACRLKEQEEALSAAQHRASYLTLSSRNQVAFYEDQLKQESVLARQGLSYCQKMLSSTFFKLLHVWSRIKCQLLFGNAEEKIRFLRWLLHRPEEIADHRFQPLNAVFRTLEQIEGIASADRGIPPACGDAEPRDGLLKDTGLVDSIFLNYLHTSHMQYAASVSQERETEAGGEIAALIRKKRARGVVAAPCIEDVRAIREAEVLLPMLAREGWLCLQARPDMERELEQSGAIYNVRQEDLLCALQNEPAVLLLIWAGSASFADQVPEKKIWYHLADYPNRASLYDTVYERMHEVLLDKADYVSYRHEKLRLQLKNRADSIQITPETAPEKVGKFLTAGGGAKLPAAYNRYDVLILGVIDYDFRFQRPQHFAMRYAEDGHRVFYVNANFNRKSSVKKRAENLYVVDFHNAGADAIYATDWLAQEEQMHQAFEKLLWRYGIRDAVVIVDYPNWVNAAEYLRRRYGFKIVVDYMDDYTGFLTPSEKNVGENCVRLLEICDTVIPSSQFLCDIAKQYCKGSCEIVRNGTEFEHFHTAYGAAAGGRRKVVGYYGAVAHWFDADKVCYLAERLPECDVVIIGAVTEWEEKLSSYDNIKLLGEKSYDRLPGYLRTFDVCLIPFDTSTDLIKATNPVKFYEYLSAGKKVVATEIPELAPFRDKYVYMANDNEAFLAYVQKCLNGTDCLAAPEECAAFAAENDWQRRYEAFARLAESAIPKVSVIVLTYNNLKLNKLCTDTILQKTAYPNYELIVVDNCSTDGTREWLDEWKKDCPPNVKIILNDENRGFAGGNNVGMRAADGQYVVLLNNDTVPTRGWLTTMVKHLENHTRLGMVGPVTNSIGNEAKIAVDYHNLNELEQFAYRYTWNHMGEEFFRVKALALFCTMIRRDVIEQVGMLDEGYKVGMFEDDDYSEAVSAAGWDMVIVDDAFVHHQDGATFKKMDKKKYETVFLTNKARFEEKWERQWEPHSYRPGISTEQNQDCLLQV